MAMATLSDFTAQFERIRPRLFGIAYRMLGSIEDGEDMVQEAVRRDGGSGSDIGTVRLQWLSADYPDFDD